MLCDKNRFHWMSGIFLHFAISMVPRLAYDATEWREVAISPDAVDFLHLETFMLLIGSCTAFFPPSLGQYRLLQVGISKITKYDKHWVENPEHTIKGLYFYFGITKCESPAVKGKPGGAEILHCTPYMPVSGNICETQSMWSYRMTNGLSSTMDLF